MKKVVVVVIYIFMDYTELHIILAAATYKIVSPKYEFSNGSVGKYEYTFPHT